MPKPTNFFEKLDGVPVHYARLAAPNGYGSRGKPYKFHCTEGFETKLNTCFAELFDVCPLGKAQVITCAGAWVDKPGMHSQGRAFDLDALFWPEKTFVTLIDGGKGDRRFYHSVEAILRRHFGTVLNYDYNLAHRDHFHFDDGEAVGFNSGSKSRVLFVQGALKYIYQKGVAINGSYGPVTKKALEDVLEEENISGSLSSVATWKSFLLNAAQKGFKVPNAQDAPNPLQSLQAMYQVLAQHDDCECRKDFEGALNAFANDDATQKWLEQYR